MSDETLNRCVEGTIWLMTSRAASIVLGTAAVIFLSRTLGPALYGYLPLIAALIEIGLIFGDAGLGPATAYFLVQHRSDAWQTEGLIRQGLRLRLFSLLPVGCMFAVGLWVITPLIGAPLLQETWLFIAVLSMFFVQVLSRWVVKVFEGLGETRRSGMVQTAFGWTSPAGQVGCALLGLGISGIVYAQIAGNGLILILLFFVLLTNFAGLGVKTTPVPTKKIVRYSIPLMLLNGTAFVYSAGGTLIAKTFGSINDVSYYGLATQIVVVLQIPAFAFASSTAPIVASQRDASIAKEASQNAIRFIIIAYAPMAFYIAIAAPGVVRLLFTEAYAPAAILLVILQPYLMASALSGFLSLLLDYSGKAQQRIYIIGTASVVFLISAFVAAERYGTAGVAWAAVGTYLPVVIFYAYLVSREFGIPLCFYSTLFLRTIISLLPGAMLISLATSTHSSIILSITIFLSLSVYIAISFYMRSICVNDIKAVVSVLRK